MSKTTLARAQSLAKTKAPALAQTVVEPPSSRVRLASLKDVAEIVRIEDLAFETDKLTKQSLRNLIKNDTASVIVAEAGQAGRLAGYCVLLFRQGTAVARLYSMAVDSAARGSGVARALMQAIEDDAQEHGSLFLRLEVRPDNLAAIALYKNLGYEPFGRHFGYYEDKSDALRFEKSLLAHADSGVRQVPYYAQTTEFTCGPAAMMMCMGAFEPSLKMTRRLEFQLWREATTIVMTAGVGGCDPVGMAVALGRRGFKPCVHMSNAEPLFLDTVRSAWKRDVMTITQQLFRHDAREMKIPIRIAALSIPRLKSILSEGGIAIVLISPYRLYHERCPHWVVVYDYNDRHMFIHDPWLEPDEAETPIAKAGLAIPLKEFDRISVYGRSRLRAAVVLEGASRPFPGGQDSDALPTASS